MRQQRTLQVKIVKISLPTGTTRERYFDMLKRGVQTGSLPDAWQVDIWWREPGDQDWIRREWGAALRAGNQGFRTVVERVIRRAE